MVKEQFVAILPFISSDLVAMIVEKERISEQEALIRLYKSELYAKLEQEDSKVWYYSTHMLYHLYKQEQETGVLEFPDV